MKRISLLVAAAGILMTACDKPEDPVGPVSTPVRPSFVVFGVVRDTAGLPVSGATAEIVEGRLQGLIRTSNDDGYFSFAGVSGLITIRVWKDGYERYAQTLVVTADVVLEIRLWSVEVIDEGEGIGEMALGRTIRSAVPADGPPCDPVRWDAHAPCRRFSFTAPSSGQLTIRIWWAGGPPLDATMMAPNGDYHAASEESDIDEIVINAFVTAGETYEVRVNSYYGYQVFNLRADLTP